MTEAVVNNETITAKALAFDPAIQEIIRFGSSVYMPDTANDADFLLVVDEAKAASSEYRRSLRAMRRMEGLLKADLVAVSDVPQQLSWDLALGVLASGEKVYGSGNFISGVSRAPLELRKNIIEQAVKNLNEVKQRPLKNAKQSKTKENKDFWTKMAYSYLFDVARNAYLYHLAHATLPDAETDATFKAIKKNCRDNGDLKIENFQADRFAVGLFVAKILKKGVPPLGVKRNNFIFALSIGDADRRLHVEVSGKGIIGYSRLIVDEHLNILAEENMPDSAYVANALLDTFEDIRGELLSTWANKIQNFLKQ